MKAQKKLLLGSDKKIAGVCSGLANYLGQDVSLVRIAVVVAAMSTGIFPAVLLYFIAVLLIPQE